jgi:hypothetical protein
MQRWNLHLIKKLKNKYELINYEKNINSNKTLKWKAHISRTNKKIPR